MILTKNARFVLSNSIFSSNVTNMSWAKQKDIEGYEINAHGFIHKLVQAQACDKGRIVIPMHPYSDMLLDLSQCTRVTIMGMNLDMENVFIKRHFQRF